MIEYCKVILLLLALNIFEGVHGGALDCGSAVLCNANPCNSASCPQNRQATCRIILDECGRCTAVFRFGGRDLTNDECNGGGGPIPPCSDGSLVTCAANPCDSASCEGEPEAECRVNRCGSCTAEFYVGQTKISNSKCAGIGPCPPGTPQADCRDPPGLTCGGQICRMFPDAECITDGCGGCTIIFVRNGRRLTKEECDGCPRRGCRPCENAVCPNNPTARCEEERCGKCKATFYTPTHRKIERCCSAETCPDGSSRFRCFKNPCDGASCSAVPGAACQPDYCGGCKRKFLLSNGIEISENQCRPIAFCPRNVRIAKCPGDFCEQRPCKRYPGASCQIDGCNGCKAVYFYQGRRLTEEECNGCPKNDRVMSCGNPCLGASCGSARCEPQVCGQCKARFFGIDRNEVTTCGTTQGCSGGLRRIQCSADPCTMNSCPGVSNAECRPNYCGGCHAEFYYPGTNRRIPEYLCVEKEICPGDLPVVGCAASPACLGETCPNFPEAQCDIDRCNDQCRVTFYEGRRRLTREDCHGCPAGVEMKQCDDPCRDAVCALYPTARCEPRVCGKCGVAFFGLDRREIADCCAEGGTITTTPSTTTSTTPSTTTTTTTTISTTASTSALSCFDSVLSTLCESDPCSEASCPGTSDATCRSNYCTCMAEFFSGQEKLTKEQCDIVIVLPERCPSSAFPPRSCRPCQEGARCPEVSTARCEDRRCRMCKAAFFGQDGTEIQACCEGGERCADGKLRFQCRKNPCDGATCPGNPFATCRPNYCGGCKAEFFSTVTNQKLSDADCILLDPCPPGTPVPGCQGPNLCLGQTCPNYPNAQCKLDACGSCNVVFYNGKTRLTQDDCFGCGRLNKPEEDCEDPCDGAYCPSDPNARCEAQRCGQCRAVFYGRNRRQISSCIGSFCANGKARFNCVVNPCSVKSCPGSPGATCTPDFCGGCNAVFRDESGRILSDFDCVEKESCPGDVPLAGCVGPDTCAGRTCPNFPNADCWIDGCDGCNVVFYDGATRLTDEDCNGCPSGLTKAADCENPCENALCPLYPTARCEARRCGMCRTVFFDESRKEIKDCCGKNTGDSCPPDQPRSECKRNPCAGATCPAEPLAQCRPNYCGGCKAEFFLGNRKLSNTDCGLCANGKVPINCGIVPPCFGKTCRAFPNAKCKSTNCGECRHWFENDNGDVVDCDATVCPADKPRRNCAQNPCDGATCPNVPTSSCRPNYCGECKAEFFQGQRKLTDYDCIEKPDRCAAFTTCLAGDGSCRCGNRQNVRCVTQYCQPNSCKTAYFDQNGMRIPDEQCVTPTPTGCPPDKPPASCRINPCDSATCPGNTQAVCRLNFCGGCFAEFYLNGRKLTDIECVERLDRCAAFTTCASDVCKCKVRNSQCIVQFCPPNTCKPLYFDASGKRLSNTECGLCEDGTERVNCGIVPPCFSSTCPAHPNAKCRSTNCGTCREWWEDENGNTVQCQKKIQCNAPQSIVNGRVNPAGRKIEIGESVTYTCNDGYKIRGNSRRICVNSGGRGVYLGSKPQCYDLRCPASTGSAGICVTQCSSNADCGFNRICCWNGCAAACVQRRDVCPGGEVYAQCFDDPCRFASCPLYPDAKCVANYCGGCSQDWYQGSTKLPPGSCEGADPRCPAPASLPRVCINRCTTSADCNFFEACCLNSCGFKHCVGYA